MAIKASQYSEIKTIFARFDEHFCEGEDFDVSVDELIFDDKKDVGNDLVEDEYVFEYQLVKIHKSGEATRKFETVIDLNQAAKGAKK